MGEKSWRRERRGVRCGARRDRRGARRDGEEREDRRAGPVWTHVHTKPHVHYPYVPSCGTAPPLPLRLRGG
jgi:hypothetical protein